MRHVFRERGCIAWHLNGGFSAVRLDRTGATFDVPTESIPLHLRKIGSRVTLVIPHFAGYDALQTQDDLHDALRYDVLIEKEDATSGSEP